jgi:hypothetical protein
MATFIDMVTRIKDDFINESITDAQVKAAIKTAIKNYDNSEFFFTEKQVSFNTIASDEWYGQSDLADIASLTRIVSATIGPYKRPLQSLDNSRIDELQSGINTGLPEWFSYFAQQIRLFPIPTSIETVNLSFFFKFSELSADTDTNAWMEEGEELIRQAAKRRIALDILHSNDMAARCKVLEDEALEGIEQETNQRKSNQELQIPQMLYAHSLNVLTGYR